MPRKAISTRTRFEIFKRDKFTCQYCGSHPPAVVLHVDHIQAVANGGGNSSDNLVTACEGCNLGKAAVPLTKAPQSLKSRAATVAESEAQLKGYHEIIQQRRARLDAQTWDIMEIIEPGCGDSTCSKLEFRSVQRFLEQLDFFTVSEAMEIAVSRIHHHNAQFRYFCGICWKTIRGDNGQN